jgi:hypothetical protein
VENPEAEKQKQKKIRIGGLQAALARRRSRPRERTCAAVLGEPVRVVRGSEPGVAGVGSGNCPKAGQRDTEIQLFD